MPRLPSVPRALHIAVPALLLAAALAAALHEAPGAFRARDEGRGAFAGLSDRDRRFLPARAYDVDLDLIELAERRIAPGETFAYIAGPDTYQSSALVPVQAGHFLRFFLLPRRSVPLAAADWVVSYGGRPEDAGVPLGPREESAPGRWIARVQQP